MFLAENDHNSSPFEMQKNQLQTLNIDSLVQRYPTRSEFYWMFYPIKRKKSQSDLKMDGIIFRQSFRITYITLQADFFLLN